MEENRTPDTAQTPDITPDNTPPDTAGSGTGYLIVRATTAQGAIPLEGARVDICAYDEEQESDPARRGDAVASLLTGRDGSTTRVPLPTVPAAASEHPGARRPYARYCADVFLVGYRRQSYIGIPIFDGITSLQSAVLVPLPEDGSGGTLPESPQYFPETGYPGL